jgi:hypothetical protein
MVKDAPLHVPLVVRIAYPPGDVAVRIVDKEGRLATRLVLQPRMYSSDPSRNAPLQAVGGNDVLIGLAGRSERTLYQLRNNMHVTGDRAVGTCYVGERLTSRLPWDWTGYASLDCLVLNDVDFSRLRREQVQAVIDWVTNGGSAVILTHQYAPKPGGVLGAVLPVRFGEQISVPGNWVRNTFGVSTDSQSKPTVRPLRLTRTVGGASLEASVPDGQGSAVVTVPLGMGRIRIVSADTGWLRKAPEHQGRDFWRRQFLRLLRWSPQATGIRSLETGAAVVDDVYGYEEVVRSADDVPASNAIMQHLLSIPELEPLPMEWVIGVLAALAVLLGPLDYLILRLADRLTWTWLTSAVVIVVFTVGAYYGVEYFRGGESRVRAVTVSDEMAGTTARWSTTISGIFASRGDDYTLAGLEPKQWYSGISPARQILFNQQQDVSRRELDFVQREGGNLPIRLPISVYSMQCLIAEDRPARLPLSAGMVADADGQPRLELHNRSDHPARGVKVWLDTDRAIDVGDLDPGERRIVRGRAERTARWDQPLSSYRVGDGYPPDEYYYDEYGNPQIDSTPTVGPPLRENLSVSYFARGVLGRTRGMLQWLANRQAVVATARYEETDLPYSLADYDVKLDHIHLVRVLVLRPKGFIHD